MLSFLLIWAAVHFRVSVSLWYIQLASTRSLMLLIETLGGGLQQIFRRKRLYMVRTGVPVLLGTAAVIAAASLRRQPVCNCRPQIWNKPFWCCPSQKLCACCPTFASGSRTACRPSYAVECLLCWSGFITPSW